MYPKAAVDVSMFLPSISHAQIPNPVKCKIPLQSPPFSRFQPKNHPLDSTKTPKNWCSKSEDVTDILTEGGWLDPFSPRHVRHSHRRRRVENTRMCLNILKSPQGWTVLLQLRAHDIDPSGRPVPANSAADAHFDLIASGSKLQVSLSTFFAAERSSFCWTGGGTG
jgi:hypothetical protein